MPQIAEIRIIEEEVWVRVGKAGEFANGLAIMSPEEIAAQQKEYSKAYDHGYADATRLAEERATERESVDLNAAAQAIKANADDYSKTMSLFRAERFAQVCAKAWGLQWRKSPAKEGEC